jgi:hypothetical protein
MSLTWHGPEVEREVIQAAIEGVNATMALCVIHAKRNHGGWENRTGRAEGSINIYQFAALQANGHIEGRWGSADVNYFIWLELRYLTLRRSADANYRHLGRLIRRAYRPR